MERARGGGRGVSLLSDEQLALAEGRAPGAGVVAHRADDGGLLGLVASVLV